MSARWTWGGCLIASVALASFPAETAAGAPERPALAGSWIRIAGPPPLERWADPAAEPVDFTVFRADDGEWQLVACVRKTKHPGKGRLLYRWTSPELERPDWTPRGIFLASDPALGHEEGLMQAPFHVKEGGRHYLFFNSRGAHLLTSADGIAWTPYSPEPVFAMGRDVCLLDDRSLSGNWIAYYTAYVANSNPATNHHTVHARTAARLTGPWSAPVDLPPLTPPPKERYLFAYAESPLVVRRGEWYYRFEQLTVYASRHPLEGWAGEPIVRLHGEDPLDLLAPEIVVQGGLEYLLAYRWRRKEDRGVYLVPLQWIRDGG